MQKTRIRAFIAIDFPDEIVKEVARIQSLLQKNKFVGKLTELENLHLTLKFLGEIEEEKLFEIKNKLKKIKFNEIKAHTHYVGSFSYNGMPRIIWLKIGGKEIIELQQKIDESLAQIFPKEKRFMSHLTVARIRYVKDINNFLKKLKGIHVRSIKFKVENFKLMKSELKPLGPVYTVIKEFELKK